MSDRSRGRRLLTERFLGLEAVGGFWDCGIERAGGVMPTPVLGPRGCLRPSIELVR